MNAIASPRARSTSALFITAIACVATLWPVSQAPVSAAGLGGGPKIAVVASAVDKAGQPVADLKAADLNAQLESSGATITDVSHVGTPTQVIILLDISSTTARGPSKMTWNAQCVSQLAQNLSKDAKFLILAFSDKIAQVYDGPNDPKAMAGTVERISRGGEAALFEVLKFMGESIAQQGIGDHTVLVVVSDGVDTVSQANQKDVARALSMAGVPLYSIILMDPAWNGQGLSKLNAKSRLQDISKSTGGDSQVMTPGEIKDFTGRIASRLAGRYRIEIDPGLAFKGKAESKITLGASRQGVEVFYADHVYQK